MNHRPLLRQRRTLALLLLLAAAPARAEGDDQQIISNVRTLVQDESNREAFQGVAGKYERFKQLVAEGKIRKADAEVFDNQLWKTAEEALIQVKRTHGTGLEAVHVVGSGAHRGEPGSRYSVSGEKISDKDLKLEGLKAVPAAEDAQQFVQKALGGVNPRRVGINFLPAVDLNDPAARIEALANPEKYATRGCLKNLDWQLYHEGTVLHWEEGQLRRTSTKEFYARNGLKPPAAPTKADAFSIVLGQEKLLNQRLVEELKGVSQAVHDAKYYHRVKEAAGLAGVNLSGQTRGVLEEATAIAQNKPIEQALTERINRHGGILDSAVAEYQAEVRKAMDYTTQAVAREHDALLKSMRNQGGAAAVAAERLSKDLSWDLAGMTHRQGQSLIEKTGLKDWQPRLAEASELRIEAAKVGEVRAVSAARVSEFTSAVGERLRPVEKATVQKAVELLNGSPAGRTVLGDMVDAIKRHPANSALLAAAAYMDLKRIAEAGEQGRRALGNEAAKVGLNWGLMLTYPEGAVSLMAGDLLALEAELLVRSRMPQAGLEAYHGARGYLEYLKEQRKLSDPAEITRLFATQAEARDAAQKWYQENYVQTYAGYFDRKTQERAFLGAVDKLYQQSGLVEMLGNYAYDPRGQQYGQWGFFGEMGRGHLTLETFARYLQYEEGASGAIDMYLDQRWVYDPRYERYGLSKSQCREALRGYLLDLWKASKEFNEKLDPKWAEALRQAQSRYEENLKHVTALQAGRDRKLDEALARVQGEVMERATSMTEKAAQDLLDKQRASKEKPDRKTADGRTGQVGNVPDYPTRKHVREEETKRLEERAKELAGKDGKLPEKKPEERTAEGRPVIPQDCTIEIAAWLEGKREQHGTIAYTVKGGKVTATCPDIVVPAEEKTFPSGGRSKREEWRATYTFEGAVVSPNLITGQWLMKYIPCQYWYWDAKGKLTDHRVSSATATQPTRIELHVDMSLSWTQESTVVEQLRTIVGLPASPIKPVVLKLGGGGVWQFRK